MLKLKHLVKVEKNARRMRDVIAVLGRYGLADWLKGLNLDWIQQQLMSVDGQKIGELSQEERIRQALTELGTTFIKLGQMLSTRADLVGPELADELKQLQSNTPADSTDSIRTTIEQELGKPPEELFETFNVTPLGSASIGQVHEARLSDGTQVVVKVQHAGIEETVNQDLEILAALAEMAQKYAPQLRNYQPVETAREFGRTLRKELDFNREKRNLEQFAQNFANDETAHFPVAYADLSVRRVLTMEWLDGVPLTNRKALEDSGEDLAEYARRGANMYLDMIFRDGFYHADPHPGNLLLLAGNVIGVLDCGMIGFIDDQLREDFEGMLLAAVSKDAQSLTDYVIRLGSVPQDFDRDALGAEISEFVVDYVGQSLEDFDLSGALNGITEIIRRYGIRLPASCSMLLKVLVMLEGTSRQLNPDFSLAELLQPYYAKAMKRRFTPKKLMHRAQRTFRDWERFMDLLPRDAADILDRLRRGRFDINLQHRRLDATINRLICGILIAALYIGSAQMWSRNAPPLFRGVSIFGVLGAVTAFVATVWLLLAIKKSGKIDSPD